MAFMRGVADTTPYESVIYPYWITVLQLLKIGIAWEAILSFTEDEISMIVGIHNALEQRQQDEETRTMARTHGNMPLNTGI